MCLSLFNVISLDTFTYEISCFTGFIIIWVNLYLIFTYCKLTGSPYKNRECYLGVRWIGIIACYWTFAFGLKFMIFILGDDYYMVDPTKENHSVYQACILGTIDFFCVILPIFFVSDTYFITAFSGSLLDPKQANEEALLPSH